MKNDKKTLILSAVLSLIEKGSKKENIKVADIAKEAGIGKGTVYEYFESREELISEAILYSCSKTSQQAEAISDCDNSFKEKIYSLMQLISEKMSSMSVFLDVLFEQGDIHGLYDRLKSTTPGSENCVKDKMKNLLKQGKAEGVITCEADDEAVYMFQHIISGFMVMMYNEKQKAGEIADKCFDRTYNLLIKALNL